MRPSISSARRQRGQVLVITALLITAMVGMLGIALDGGRIYVDRRVLQTAADASGLGAADAYAGSLAPSGGAAPKCQDGTATQTAATTAAFTAGVQEFANQVGQPTGAYTSNGAFEATYSVGGYSLKLDEVKPAGSADAATLQIACVFQAVVKHGLWMAFIQVIGGTTSTTGACTGVAFPCQEVLTNAQAIGAATLPIPNAWVFILDPSTSGGPFPCGNGTSMNSLINGGTATLTVNGSIVSDGNINWNGNPLAVLNDGGSILDHCDTTAPYPSGDVTYNGGGGYVQTPTTFGDPFGTTGLAWVAGWWGNFKGFYAAVNPSTTGTAVELKPGEYTVDPSFGAGCWFLEPGQYQWDKGLSAHSGNGLISNELMPPGGEDATAAALSTETPFSWDHGNTAGLPVAQQAGVGNPGCKGSIAADVIAGSLGSPVTYSIRVASARQDKVPSSTTCTSGCWRESYLSANNASGCVTASLKSNGTAQIAISNVPGMGNVAGSVVGLPPALATYTPANRYDIYTSIGGCADTTITDWHYLSSATFDITGAQTQTSLLTCPFSPPTSATPDTYVANPTCSLGGVISASIPSSSFASAAAGGTSACPLNTAVTDAVLLGSHTISGWTVGCTHPYQSNTASCLSPNGIDGTTNCYDVANEHMCLTNAGVGNYCNFYKPKQTYTTPGGVLFYVPSTFAGGGAKCIDNTGNGAQYYVYGTDALYDVVFYAPDNCSGSTAKINGGSGGSFVGWGYLPGHNDGPTLEGNGSPFSGGIVTWDLTIQGTNSLTVPGGVPSFLFTVALGSRLLVCTNTTPGCPSP